jgi:hypothetical protein
MTNEISRPVWNIPFIEFLQFPWRFLNFAALFISFLAGFIIASFIKKFRYTAGLTLAVIVIFLTVFFNAKLFVPQKIIEKDSSFYTSASYLNWTASKISDEYLPKGFISPKHPYDVVSLNSIKYNAFFKKDTNWNSLKRFSFEQNALEKLSNFLSFVGVLALLIVIISKPKKIR